MKDYRWGIWFQGGNNQEGKFLIYQPWNGCFQKRYEREPTWPLLFETRQAARDWCKKQKQKYKDRKNSCSKWRFEPVKVDFSFKVTL